MEMRGNPQGCRGGSLERLRLLSPPSVGPSSWGVSACSNPPDDAGAVSLVGLQEAPLEGSSRRCKSQVSPLGDQGSVSVPPRFPGVEPGRVPGSPGRAGPARGRPRVKPTRRGSQGQTEALVMSEVKGKLSRRDGPKALHWPSVTGHRWPVLTSRLSPDLSFDFEKGLAPSRANASFLSPPYSSSHRSPGSFIGTGSGRGGLRILW